MKTEKLYFHPETLLEPPQPSPLDTRIEPPVARKAVTLGDVARHVGVGTMTVSRALHKPEMVSEPLRVKILKAVHELGYVPNRVASGLASGTARLVPVVIPTLLHPVYIPFLEGASKPAQPWEILRRILPGSRFSHRSTTKEISRYDSVRHSRSKRAKN